MIHPFFRDRRDRQAAVRVEIKFTRVELVIEKKLQRTPRLNEDRIGLCRCFSHSADDSIVVTEVESDLVRWRKTFGESVYEVDPAKVQGQGRDDSPARDQ